MAEDCKLCQLEVSTTAMQYDSTDGKFSVVQCIHCGTPEAVWRRHEVNVSPERAENMLVALSRFADQAFGDDNWIMKRGVPADGHISVTAQPKTAKNPCIPCAAALFLNPRAKNP